MKELLLKIDDKAIEKVTKMLWCRGVCDDTIGADVQLTLLIMKAIENNEKTLTVELREKK